MRIELSLFELKWSTLDQLETDQRIWSQIVMIKLWNRSRLKRSNDWLINKAVACERENDDDKLLRRKMKIIFSL